MGLFAELKQYFRNFRANFFRKPSLKDISLIKNTHLFDSLGEKSFHKLLKSFKYKIYDKGNLIFKEKSKGNTFYIIAEGSISVFTTNIEGKKIHLARLEEGSYFGEQSLIGHASKSRNASIEAITDTKLIVIKGKYLKEIISYDTELKDRLLKTGYEQLIHNIVESVPNYKALRSHFEKNVQAVVRFEKDTVIFREIDISDCVYIILKGSVKIIMPIQGKNQEITLVHSDMFGELGVLKNAPRAAAAVAAEYTELLKIDAEEFKQYYNADEELKKLVDTLTQTYTLPNRGAAFQFIGRINNLTAVTTSFKLKNGREVIATKSTDNSFIMMEKTDKPSKMYSHEKENGTKIEIYATSDYYITCVKSWGNWRYLSAICEYILDNKPINPQVLEDFTANGIFTSDNVDQSEIVCVCMAVTKDRIEELIESGCNSLAVISEKTGAGTVCGSCRPSILAILGQDVWMPAILTKIRDHNPNIASFTIEPTEGVFNAFQPGEHLVIQLNIDGNWIERAYTISDLPKDNYHRITVKKEPDGLLSNWLATHDCSHVSIFVSQPQGNFKLVVEDPSPVICFAGGIGITPFITFAKALMKSQSQRAMHLVYIAPSVEEFIFLDELEELKKAMPTFKLTLWERNKSGYLTDENVSSFVKGYKGANIFICGPEGFESSLIKTLENIDFRSDKIFVEKFTYANPIITSNV